MSQQKDLREVIRNDLCVACGACVAAEEGLQLRFNREKMMYEPSEPGGKAAASVCPSIQVDFEWLHRALFGDAPVTPMGVVEAIMLAQSTSFERNMQASSGGLIRELLLEYLARDGIDGAIALSHVEGLLFEPRLIVQAEQVAELPGSIYHNVPYDNALRLLSSHQGRHVLVATPCQLEGIYKYIFKHRPELAERIHITIGLTCGWSYTHHAIEAICEYKGVDFDRIQGIAFRGGGPIGDLRIQLPGKTVEVNRRTDFDYMVAFDRSFNLPRCHLCVNHINFLGDIVVGDAWLACTAHSKTGVSIVICRTKEAVEVMQILREKGRIRCIEVTEAEITESQSRALTYGDFSYAYADYLKEITQFRPDTTGPNRSSAILSPRQDVERFHREKMLKTRLRQQGRYRRLWWRKIAVDVRRDLWRYLRSQFSRKIGSLLGHRSTVPPSRLHDFR